MKGPSRGKVSRLLIAVAAAATLTISGRASALDLRQQFTFNIPPQRLASALIEFSRQARIQVVVGKEVDDLKTKGVRGRQSVAEALTALLRGSTLTYSVVGNTAISVGAPPSATQAKTPIADGGEGERNSPGRFRVAQGAEGSDAGTAASVTPGHDGSLQEVIVTAQKYRQRAIDVPISLTVIGGPELQTLKITNLEDLQFYVPGLQVDDDGDELVITIRGVSNLGGIQAIVGEYLDEADLTSNSSFGLDLNTYDLARVEVLKGPQGTLYGDGSLGGTIRYVTNKPALNEVQMGVDVTALFDQYGAPESRIEAVLNAPVIANVLGLRIAADLDNGGGWVDQPASGQRNINGKNLADVRLEGRWEPRPDLTVDAMEVIHRNRFGRVTGENPVGVFTQVFNLTTTPQLEDNYNLSNITLRWDPRGVEILNSTSYWTHYNAYSNYGAIYPFAPPPSPSFESYQTSGATTQESLSDELRVSSDDSGRGRWTLGGLFKRIGFNSLPALYYFDVPGPPGSPLPTPYSAFADINSNSGSVFGDASYRVLGRLVLGAGLRYFRDEGNGLLSGDAAREQGTFTSVDPRFYVRYGVSKDMNVYASAAKGFRSGGFNGLGLPQYQPEHVWTYDLGTKMRLWDGHLSVDSDVFLTDYAGYQIIGILPPPSIPLAVTRNAGDARVKGIEGDVMWIPREGWLLSANGDYLDARFVHVGVLDSAYDVGDPLDYTPRYQITASAERDFRWLGRNGFARVQYAQRAPTTYRNRSFGPWYYSQSDHLYLLGFHAGINWTNRLKLGVFVENLLNVRGFTGPDVIELNSPREQPRTFGVDLAATLE